jgi:LytS/YehU family sensor histidine kinase
MRYVIAESSVEKIALSKELKYISDYIDLERLRLTEKVDLQLILEGDPEGKQIAPLIFIPLIENAFKYGVSTTEKAAIHIHIQVDAYRLKLRVINTKNPLAHSGNGTGIVNMKRRLELIYSGKFELSLKDTNSEYTIELSLDLT